MGAAESERDAENDRYDGPPRDPHGRDVSGDGRRRVLNLAADGAAGLLKRDPSTIRLAHDVLADPSPHRGPRNLRIPPHPDRAVGDRGGEQQASRGTTVRAAPARSLLERSSSVAR